MIPAKIGMSLTMPLAKIATAMVVSSDAKEMISACSGATNTSEQSTLLPKAILTATGDRPRQITMITEKKKRKESEISSITLKKQSLEILQQTMKAI